MTVDAEYAGASRSKPWWTDDRDPHSWIFSLMQEQYGLQASRYATFRRYCNIYEYGYKGADRTPKGDRAYDEANLYMNRAQNAVDTVVSEVMSASCGILVTTEGGTFEEREAAKQATKGLRAVMSEAGYDRIEEQYVNDAACAGNGHAQIYADLEEGRPCVERVDPRDMLIDEAEATYGKPRCIYRRHLVDKHWLLERVGDGDPSLEGNAQFRREKVEGAPEPQLLSGDDPPPGPLVELLHAWHLPSIVRDEDEDEDADDEKSDAKDDGDEAEAKPTRSPRKLHTARERRRTDGRYAVVLQNVTLKQHAYRRRRAPFVNFCPRPSKRGYWGIPLMRQLAPAQRELEILDRKLQRAHQRMGGAHILAPRECKIDKRKFTNDSGDIIEFDPDGGEPKEWTPAPAHPQTYQYQDQVATNMLRFSGIPQFSASGQIPAGMQNASGRALRLLVDQGSKYLGPWLRERERCRVEAAELFLDAIEEILEYAGEYTTQYDTGEGYETIDWKPILQMRRKLRLKVEPINMLSTSPAARAAELTEYMQAGAITADEWRRQSGWLDLASMSAMDFADEDVIEKMLCMMLHTGRAVTPNPWDDFQKILAIGGKFLNMNIARGEPMEKLQPIVDYLTDAHAEVEKRKAAAAAVQPGPMPGAPPGGGQPMMPGPGAPPMPQGAPQGPPMPLPNAA